MIRDWALAICGPIAILAFAAYWLAYAIPARAGETICGEASFYGIESCVKPPPLCRTANGERFTGQGLTAASRTLPFNTRLRVTYGAQSVVVRVNDRGPAQWTGRVLDLSEAAARQLGLIRAGHGKVCAEKL